MWLHKCKSNAENFAVQKQITDFFFFFFKTQKNPSNLSLLTDLVLFYSCATALINLPPLCSGRWCRQNSKLSPCYTPPNFKMRHNDSCGFSGFWCYDVACSRNLNLDFTRGMIWIFVFVSTVCRVSHLPNLNNALAGWFCTDEHLLLFSCNRHESKKMMMKWCDI